MGYKAQNKAPDKLNFVTQSRKTSHLRISPEQPFAAIKAAVNTKITAVLRSRPGALR